MADDKKNDNKEIPVGQKDAGKVGKYIAGFIFIVMVLMGYMIRKPAEPKYQGDRDVNARLSEGPLTKTLTITKHWSGKIDCRTRVLGDFYLEALTDDFSFVVRWNGGTNEGGGDYEIPAIRDRPEGWQFPVPPERLVSVRVCLAPKDAWKKSARVSYTQELR